MAWKEFFEPTLTKGIIFIILLGLTVFIPKTVTICSPTPESPRVAVCGKVHEGIEGIGYPHFLGTKASGDALYYGFSILNFLINLIVYYVISCVLVAVHRKIRR